MLCVYKWACLRLLFLFHGVLFSIYISSLISTPTHERASASAEESVLVGDWAEYSLYPKKAREAWRRGGAEGCWGEQCYIIREHLHYHLDRKSGVWSETGGGVCYFFALGLGDKEFLYFLLL